MRRSNICGIHGFRILVGITIMTMLLVGGVEASSPVYINDCTYIYSPGEYTLTQDIITDSRFCINIYSNDVIFDGAGHTIDGTGFGFGYTSGVALPGVNGSGSVQQVTVKNLTVTGWYNGISLGVGSSNITLNNNNASNNTYGIYLSNSNYNNLGSNNVSNNNYGIYLSNSNYNNLSSNNASNNNYGIYLSNSIHNIIYNNYFYNLFNAYDTSFLGNNYWNTTKQAGTNIIGGPYLGGNYWSDYAGNDTDGDGLGNTLIPYNSYGNIINGGDYLPLTEEKVTQNVSAGGTVTTDPEGTGPTVSDPVETSVTTPDGGIVSIKETSTIENPPSGFEFLGQQVTITAPDATTGDPLIIVFQINDSKIPNGENEDTIVISKWNESESEWCAILNCNVFPDSETALPDPCVSNRTRLQNDDIEITVLTSSASIWGIFIASPVELIQNLIDDVEALNLQQGIDNSLDAKLDATVKALDDVNANNDAAAINSIEAFINAVNAQRGKQISGENADALIATAQEIIALLTDT